MTVLSFLASIGLTSGSGGIISINSGFLLVGLITAAIIVRRLLQHPLPPGPPALPLLGNILQLPRRESWRQYDLWKQEYGSIYRLIAGKDTIIVLGNWETAHELLNKRSSNYSSRPRCPMAFDLLYKKMHTLLRPSGHEFAMHKRAAAPLVAPRSARLYIPLQQMESLRAMRYLLEHATSQEVTVELEVSNKAKDMDNHEAVKRALNCFAASVIFSLVYGFPVDASNAPVMASAHVVQHNFVEAMKPGTWPCDILPALNYLPDWLAPWKRKASEWFEYEKAHHLRNLRRGKASPSWNWTKELLAGKNSHQFSELELAYDMGILADAGLDTTGQTIEMFVMIAVTHPLQVLRAQTELDDVVGRGRLPAHSDKEKLPYTCAFIEEVTRWRPLTIAGVPHSNLREDVYNGYRIPKGSVIIPNVWSIHGDAAVYGDPELFRPERWLEKPQLPNASFGFGRRVCVGETIARQSLFITISHLLWTFRFDKALDENNRVIEVDTLDLTDYFVVRPKPFPFRLSPRFSEVSSIIQQTWSETDTDVTSLLTKIGCEYKRTNESGRNTEKANWAI